MGAASRRAPKKFISVYPIRLSMLCGRSCMAGGGCAVLGTLGVLRTAPGTCWVKSHTECYTRRTMHIGRPLAMLFNAIGVFDFLFMVYAHAMAKRRVLR